MGRHGRNSPEAAAPIRGHRGRRRRNTGARTGLLGASAAMAVGAVAVATGLVPSPGSAAGGHYLFGDEDGPGNLTQADGTPTTLATDGAQGGLMDPGTSSAGTTGSGRPSSSVSPSSSPTRTAARPTKPVTRRPTSPATVVRRTVSAAPTVVAGAPSGTMTAAADQVLSLVNQQRAQAGCQPLTGDSKLTELASNYSAEMAARGFFDHTDPDGKSPWDRASALGISNLGGENIAEGQPDAQAVMDAWMNSPGHRANILNCDYRTIGIGVHYATGSQSGGPWWTQDFGF